MIAVKLYVRKIKEMAGIGLLLASSALAAIRLAGARIPPLGETAAFLTACWFFAAMLMAIPYCRRFGGGPRDWIKIGILVGLLLSAPLAPFFWSKTRWDVEAFYWTLAGVSLFAFWLNASLLGQGRYGGTERDFPELDGHPGSVARDVLRRTGLAVASIRVAPFDSFNAVVQGLHRCIVIVDRRAASTLPPEEFAALIAHEAGHVKYGGIFPDFTVLPLLLLVANALVVSRCTPTWSIVCLAASHLLLSKALSQWLELRCDRFGSALASSEVMTRLLRRIHEDGPTSFDRLANRIWLSPFFSHPPLQVRISSLAGSRDGAQRAYVAIWATAFTLLLGVPAIALVAQKVFGLDLGRHEAALTRGPLYAYGLAWIVLANFLSTRYHKRERRTVLKPRTGSWFAIMTAAGWLVTAALFVKTPLGGLIAFCLSVLLTIVGLFTGAFRFGEPVRRRRIRRAAMEIHAAIVEGLTEEGLALADAALRRHPRENFLLLQKAACCVYLGRTDDAAACLATPLEAEDTRRDAELLLASIEGMRGNFQKKLELAKKVCEADPADSTAWLLRGSAAREMGRLEEAEEACARACELSENEASAVASRILTAMDRSPPPEGVDDWIASARAKDARNPSVLLASARWNQVKGRLEAARTDLEAAFAELRREGMMGWIPLYEREGRRWGLLDPGGTGGPA